MPEKEPQITFTDRRKISSDGEIRPEAAQKAAEEQSRAAETPQPSSSVPSAATGAAPSQAPVIQESQDEAAPEGPTAQESAESHAAYQQTTQQLDEMLRAKAPDSSHLGPVVFDHLVESMSMTAMVGMLA